MSTYQRDEMDLETIVDRQGLTVVLSMLANICVQKAAHLREAWQDVSSAHRKWDAAAKRIARVEAWAEKIGPA